MTHAQLERSAAELVQTVESAGFSVSKAKLRRWQRVGLIPRPRQRGLGRGRGTETLYPNGAAEQVVALCQHLAVRRSLPEAGWRLWWEGYPIPPEIVRRMIDHHASYFEALQKKWYEDLETDNLNGDLFSLVEEGRENPIRDPLTGLMRRRVGRDDYTTLIVTVFGLIAGDPPTPGEYEEGLLRKAFRIPSDIDIQELVQGASETLNPASMRKAFDGASIDDLESARDEIKSVLRFIGGINSIAALLVGDRMSNELVDIFARPNMADGAALVLLWLPLRKSKEAQEVFSSVKEAVQGIAQGVFSAEEVISESSDLE